MSLLVHYTLKSADTHDAQREAMKVLVAGLKSEGVTGVDYSCFATQDPLKFMALLEFDDDAGKAAFIDSSAFAKYRETVGPTFASPPQTSDIEAIISTKE